MVSCLLPIFTFSNLMPCMSFYPFANPCSCCLAQGGLCCQVNSHGEENCSSLVCCLCTPSSLSPITPLTNIFLACLCRRSHLSSSELNIYSGTDKEFNSEQQPSDFTCAFSLLHTFLASHRHPTAGTFLAPFKHVCAYQTPLYVYLPQKLRRL